MEDLVQTNGALLNYGMDIKVMKLIKKRLETGEGGGLARAAYPAAVLTLVLSNVVGNPLKRNC